MKARRRRPFVGYAKMAEPNNGAASMRGSYSGEKWGIAHMPSNGRFILRSQGDGAGCELASSEMTITAVIVENGDAEAERTDGR